MHITTLKTPCHEPSLQQLVGCEQRVVAKCNELWLNVTSDCQGSLWPGLRIQSDIDRIRIQPLRTNRIRIHEFLKTGSIQTPLSYILWWVLIRNCCLFIFWQSLVMILKFSSDKSLLETFLHFFLFQNLGWNRIRIKREIWGKNYRSDRIRIRNPGCCQSSKEVLLSDLT